MLYILLHKYSNLALKGPQRPKPIINLIFENKFNTMNNSNDGGMGQRDKSPGQDHRVSTIELSPSTLPRTRSFVALSIHFLDQCGKFATFLTKSLQLRCDRCQGAHLSARHKYAIWCVHPRHSAIRS